MVCSKRASYAAAAFCLFILPAKNNPVRLKASYFSSRPNSFSPLSKPSRSHNISCSILSLFYFIRICFVTVRELALLLTNSIFQELACLGMSICTSKEVSQHGLDEAVAKLRAQGLLCYGKGLASCFCFFQPI